MRLLFSLSVLCAMLCALASAQNTTSDATLHVEGDVASPLILNRDALARMPRATLEHTEGGQRTRCEGVWLHEVIATAGAPAGEALRGKALASYVLCTAKDGYQVLFSLAELDPAFQESRVLLADRAGGNSLPAAAGPFRLIVPQDRRGARSIRMLERIKVVQLRK